MLVDEAIDLVERTANLGHVVLDEAQDLSPMQCRAVGRRCRSGSATVLGDIAQGTTPWAAESWYATLAHLGKPTATVRELRRGYRVPREIIDYASLLLPHTAPDVAPPISVRQSGGSLAVHHVDAAAVADEAVLAAGRALLEDGSIGVITADARATELAHRFDQAGLAHQVLGEDGGSGADVRLALVPASLAKGLEFDHVITVEPAEIVAGEARGGCAGSTSCSLARCHGSWSFTRTRCRLRSKTPPDQSGTFVASTVAGVSMSWPIGSHRMKNRLTRPVSGMSARINSVDPSPAAARMSGNT